VLDRVLVEPLLEDPQGLLEGLLPLGQPLQPPEVRRVHGPLERRLADLHPLHGLLKPRRDLS